jgi:EAL domain-containing protein (putative c-di-GMP-specific phosphodiesterase class I)
VQRWGEASAGLSDPTVQWLSHDVAERLAGRLRAEDGLFVLGAGRFGVVAEARHGADSARTLADALETALDRPVMTRAHPPRPVGLDARVGWVVAPDEAATADVALALAQDGTFGPRTEPLPLAPAVEPAVVEDPEAATRLRDAIAGDQLVLHYQPIVRLGNDHIPVVEALVRWKDPERGLLPPSDFIPLAEETGLIAEIGAWALRTAAKQLRAWDELGLPPVRCAVNLSARELCSETLPARVADALAESGLGADRLEVELTESMFAEPDATAQMLRRLRALGVRVAIDDFGTGYSSLAYLTRFAVDVIKVDGAFVRRAAAEPDAAEVVRAIVALGHQLGLEVVAEGVETIEQLRFVQHQGMDLVQGWVFCEALPADELARWLAWAEQRVVERDGPRPVDGADAALPAGRRRAAPLSARDRVVRGATLLTGGAAGAVLGLPFTDGDAAHVPQGWAPAITVWLACVVAAFVLVDALRRSPRFAKPWRDPELRFARKHVRATRCPDGDPLLLAAAWGVARAE